MDNNLLSCDWIISSKLWLNAKQWSWLGLMVSLIIHYCQQWSALAKTQHCISGLQIMYFHSNRKKLCHPTLWPGNLGQTDEEIKDKMKALQRSSECNRLNVLDMHNMSAIPELIWQLTAVVIRIKFPYLVNKIKLL